MLSNHINDSLHIRCALIRNHTKGLKYTIDYKDFYRFFNTLTKQNQISYL